MKTPDKIERLVEVFDRNLEAYKSSGYKEANVRSEFIDPFFEALGWDVYNKQGYAEAYKDVITEDAIKVGGATKAPDYCFRIGGARKFFVEAKKPSVDIKGDVNPAYQLRRYAWSAGLPLSILTDFEEFAVYDCRLRPSLKDKPGHGRVLYLTYHDYLEKWEEIAAVFSKQAVLEGRFDKYVESKKKRATQEVDTEFLKEIEEWRDLLARNLALRNPDLGIRELNFAVQKTIDRIIFLRICEDRGIETYGRLQALINGKDLYPRLKKIFLQADDKYNSGLFHFRREKDEATPPDELTLDLKIDDKVLKEIFKRLYYPESPYEFSVLGAEILGHIYEQFLGKVIKLTKGHQAKVEEKPEVRKAGGVYYTPTYIVDYIVKNTVGKLCEKKTPKKIEKLRILDPACGSGSFLIGAYSYLIDYHRDWYLENLIPARTARGHISKATLRKHVPGRNPEVPIYQGKGGQWYLTTREKKRILLNNIYGVDIDSQAVEVTKLSLLLKVLENENQDSLERQMKLWRERALPDLGNNIKCGNSLIGPDFYDNQQLTLLEDEEQTRVNAFDWTTEFPEIMASGGFDAVIGNPPWGASFTKPELKYLREHYSRVITRMIDSYIYFIDRSIQISKFETPIGFIIPSTVLNQVDARSVRELLLKRGLAILINLGQGVFGPNVLNTSTIFVSVVVPRDALLVANLSKLAAGERPNALAKVNTSSWKIWRKQVQDDPHRTFFTGALDETALLQRLRQLHPPLSRFIAGGIQRGVSPDIAAAHTVSIDEARKLQLESELLRPSVSGLQIKRYQDWKIDQFIIYTLRSTPIKEYPQVLKFLENFKHKNTCKEVKEGKHPWWSLHRPRDPAIFASPKFVGLTTSKTIELIYDSTDSIFVTDAMYVFSTVRGVDPWSFMAIMQSKLFLFLYRISNQGESRIIPQVKATKLISLPFPICNKPQPGFAKLNELCRQMYHLHRQYTASRTPQGKMDCKRQIANTNSQIGRVVYELYGLTEKEIKLVEEETR